MIPGSNLLNRAMRLIQFTPISYYQWKTRTLNSARQWVATYMPPVTVQASVQAVARNTYVQLGLDLQRNYVNVFVSKDVVDLARDVSGDQFVFDNRLFQIETQTSWFLRDGWAEAMAVEVSNGTPLNLPKTS
jgi:hypothetical protein